MIDIIIFRLWENELFRSENTHTAATEEGCTNKTNLQHASAQYKNIYSSCSLYTQFATIV